MSDLESEGARENPDWEGPVELTLGRLHSIVQGHSKGNKYVASERIYRSHKALEKRLETAERDRDGFLLLAGAYHELSSEHDENRFLGWLRRNAGRSDVPDLIAAYFKDRADKKRPIWERITVIVMQYSLVGWAKRLAALAREEKHGG